MSVNVQCDTCKEHYSGAGPHDHAPHCKKLAKLPYDSFWFEDFTQEEWETIAQKIAHGIADSLCQEAQAGRPQALRSFCAVTMGVTKSLVTSEPQSSDNWDI
jgi:hypothetical protein